MMFLMNFPTCRKNSCRVYAVHIIIICVCVRVCLRVLQFYRRHYDETRNKMVPGWRRWPENLTVMGYVSLTDVCRFLLDYTTAMVVYDSSNVVRGGRGILKILSLVPRDSRKNKNPPPNPRGYLFSEGSCAYTQHTKTHIHI